MFTLKLTMLLCLVTAQRSQTLRLLKLSIMISEGPNIIITISDLVKPSSVRINSPIIKLNPYADKATALHEYIGMTKDLRKEVDNLFISYARPHLAVTKNTISRWIKSMLERGEIDISIYKSHSIRAAASTEMKEILFPVEDILRIVWMCKHLQIFMTNRLTALVRPVTYYLTQHRRMWHPTGFEISSAPLCSCPAAEYIDWARLTYVEVRCIILLW